MFARMKPNEDCTEHGYISPQMYNILRFSVIIISKNKISLWVLWNIWVWLHLFYYLIIAALQLSVFIINPVWESQNH